ncbi:sialate O-acetylesterase-like [Clytia hemisphaerica]|uniref:Sialate O-acetylesterase domain-containing protein n=1 Tax=Clytia hemisphaerica TaxID=252671 RepID=A0A7M6DK57_9CNID
MQLILIITALALKSQLISCEFRFANSYGSNMVLQRAPLSANVWGFGEEGQKVEVTVTNAQHEVQQTKDTTVKKDWNGNAVWSVKLSPMKAGGPYNVTAKSNNVQIVLSNLLFGDVWLCSGQSNMQFTVGMSTTADEEIASAQNHSDIRLFSLNQFASEKPLQDFDLNNVLLKWSVASKDTVGGPAWKYFSALCWMYGRRLYDQYKIPIGLVDSDWGGTCAEAWSSPEALAKCGLKKNSVQTRGDRVRLKRDVLVERTVYEDSNVDPNSYSVLWNSMIRPFLNMTIKGAIWYQGEHNTIVNKDYYACVFPEMINNWRKKWFEGTDGSTDQMFPFGFAQLATVGADFSSKRPDFAKIRYEQTANYGYVPNQQQQNVFMAVAMDLPDDKSPFGSIHPRDKATVADRLVLGARALVYGESSINFQGPIMDTCSLFNYGGNFGIKVAFRNAEKGIQVKGPTGFEVKASGSTEWTPAEIISPSDDHQSILLSLPFEPSLNVTMVRYAWSQTPCEYKKCAVYSIENDLPSPPGVCFIP